MKYKFYMILVDQFNYIESINISYFEIDLITAYQRMIDYQTRKNDKAVIIFASKVYLEKQIYFAFNN